MSCSRKLKFLIKKFAEINNTDNHRVNKIKDKDIKSVSAVLANTLWLDIKTRKIIVIIAEKIKRREFNETNNKKTRFYYRLFKGIIFISNA